MYINVHKKAEQTQNNKYQEKSLGFKIELIIRDVIRNNCLQV